MLSLRNAVLGFVLLGAAGGTLPAAAAERTVVLSTAERSAIARAFAPVLVFHPLEEYFPTSPVFPLDSSRVLEAAEEHLLDLRTRLGSHSERAAHYRALSIDEKVRRSAVQYRVFSRLVDGRAEVVAEVPCYYVFNQFSVRVPWLPYRVPDNHPHDLERVYFVLRPLGTGGAPDHPDEEWATKAFRIERVVTNAHDGSIPPNQYLAGDGETLAPPIAVLIEHGSHAMAPDINRDGQFTPKIDSTATTKLLWGIRDRGATWGRYRSSYMDLRGEIRCDSAVRLHLRRIVRRVSLTRCLRPSSCKTGSAAPRCRVPIDATSSAIRLG